MAPVDLIFEKTGPVVSTGHHGKSRLAPGETPFSDEGLSAVPAQNTHNEGTSGEP